MRSRISLAITYTIVTLIAMLNNLENVSPDVGPWPDIDTIPQPHTQSRIAAVTGTIASRRDGRNRLEPINANASPTKLLSNATSSVAIANPVASHVYMIGRGSGQPWRA